jgi:hypothetical protein
MTDKPRLSEIMAGFQVSLGENGLPTLTPSMLAMQERFRLAIANDPPPPDDFDPAVPREERISRIANAVTEILAALGLDPVAYPSVAETPMRYARMLVDEFSSGLAYHPADDLGVVFEEGHDELIIIPSRPRP